VDDGAKKGAVVEASHIDRATLEGLTRLAPDDPRWTAALSVMVEPEAAAPRDEPRVVAVARPGRPDGGDASALPPVIGRFEVKGGRLRFIPRFPLAAGVSYLVRLDPVALAELAGTTPTSREPVTAHVAIPSAAAARTTRVAAVYPPGDRVPENLLRWYVQLSAPMAPGEALGHVKLLDEAGREVAGAFLETSEELWDPERRRLTLLFDPGRVKRGVRTNLEEGAPLVAGRRYRLVIDAEWRDGAGAALKSGYERAFEATAADRTSPDPDAWSVSAPSAGSRAPLRLRFGEPLDHALAQRMIAVHDANGRRVAGTVTLADDDHSWSFAPDEPWRAGQYALHVDAALEDVAGNSVARLFDADRRAGDMSAESAAAHGRERVVRFEVAAR
jgi:hypothetical protein